MLRYLALASVPSFLLLAVQAAKMSHASLYVFQDVQHNSCATATYLHKGYALLGRFPGAM